jgi:hypothetical protein
MDNFDLKKFVSEKTLLNESTPGFDTRKQGESLPTLESVKAAYEAKKGRLHENQVMGYSLLINGKFYNNKIYKSESIANGQLTTLLGDVKSELGLEGGRKDTYYFGTKKGDKDLEQRLKDLEQAKVVAVTYK